MPESEWAKRMAREFEAAKARKSEEDGRRQEEEKDRREAASQLWAEVKQAFKAKARLFNAAVGEEILTWEAGDANSFGLHGKGIKGSVKGTYQQAEYEIRIEVVGRVVPLQVAFGYRTGKYFLRGPGGEGSGPDDLAQTLVEEFLSKY
jgi:hypothetical protein